MFIMTKLLVSLFLKFQISVMLDDQVEMRAYSATHLAGVKVRPFLWTLQSWNASLTLLSHLSCVLALLLPGLT